LWRRQSFIALLKDKDFERIAGVDVSYSVLEKANDKLKIERLPDFQKKRINLFQGSLTYKDKRFLGYDAATIIEVIEHLDVNRLAAFERVLFEYSRPHTILITTPNFEYNTNYNNLYSQNLRHKDHRFEWTRIEFENWAHRVCEKYGYSVEFIQIGDIDNELGAPTQMGVFTL
jgi:3' terminal RNA ribose 2'-O-methyltransferase Hen1